MNSGYGLTYMDGTKYEWRKSTDKIDLSTKLGYKIMPEWYTSILGSFKSQDTKGGVLMISFQHTYPRRQNVYPLQMMMEFLPQEYNLKQYSA